MNAIPKPAQQQPETQVVPKPELERRSRRRFSTEFELRIIAKADACQYGELGALRRSEGLYSGPFLGSDIRPGHLEQVELVGNLKQGTGVSRVGVQAAEIRHDLGDL